MGGSTWEYLPAMNEGRWGATAQVLPSTRNMCDFNIAWTILTCSSITNIKEHYSGTVKRNAL